MFVCAIVVACGSRTGLLVDSEEQSDGSITPVPTTTVTPPNPDAPFTSDNDMPPLVEGGLFDVKTDCPETSYCDPSDLSYIYKCGVRIGQCSSLEQCEVRCSGEDCGAVCVNPCRDTLGQNTSNGCEFYSVEMDVTNESEGACFAVFVVNQWKTGEPARLEVDRGGTILPLAEFARIPVGTGTNLTYAPFDPNKGLARDQVAILFLSRDPAAANGMSIDPRTLASCPAGVTPAVAADAALHGTGVGSAFHIRSNVPIVAYQMLPYGGGRARITGATLLLPTNVWGTNYLAANGYAPPDPMVIDEARAGPTMAVIAQADGTLVTLLPTTTVTGGGGLAGGPANAPLTYALNQGQYLQFTQNAELTGSAISSNKPVAVIGGNTLADIPTTSFRADSTEQMLPPVSALGSEYVAVRYRARLNRPDESVPWRVVGAANGTVLTYDPAPPAGAPTTLAAHQVAEFNSPGPFVVHSQDDSHPFYFAQYMTGGSVPGVTDPFDPMNGEGDPEYLNVTPPAQFLPRYTFFTDPTYPETNLVIVRVRDAASGLMPDVAIDCAGTIGGWAPVGNSGTFEFTRFDLSSGNFQGQNGCDNGVHSIVGTFAASDAGAGTPNFGVNIWGWGNTVTDTNSDENGVDEANPKFTKWVSYAYPAGANFQPLNSVTLSTNH